MTTTEYDDGARFRHFIFLNAIQALGAAVVAFVFIKLRGQKLVQIDGSILEKLVQLAVLSTISSPFSYASLKHIDYPTMVLGKSCKLVPVVLMNFLLYRKTFPVYKYIVVLMITMGVSGFMLLQPSKKVHC